MRRSPELLTLADLPGADPARFDEWKRLHRRARIAPLVGPLIYASAFITVPVIGGGIGWLLPIVFWFAYMFAYAVPLARAERRLAAELGVPAALGLPATGGSTRARKVIKIVLIVWLVSFVLGLILLAVQLASSKSGPTLVSDRAVVVAGPAGSAVESYIVHLKDEPGDFQGARVPPQYFDVEGVRPHAGRFFLSAEHAPDAAPVVVIAYEVWQQFFGGELSALGEMLEINGSRTTIVGVAPVDFKSPGMTDFWTPREAVK